MPSQKAIDFHSRLGTGIDVDWCKNRSDREDFTKALAAGVSVPQLFKDKGFDHARIRIKEYDLTTVEPTTGKTLLQEICDCVEACIDAGLIAIVAFQAESWKENPCDAQADIAAEWWRNVALALSGSGDNVALNTIIETTLIGTTNNTALNNYHRKCCDAIWSVDSERVTIVCPSKICNPDQLKNLIVPEGHCFGEVHGMASGISKTMKDKLWTTGTEAERAAMKAKIKTASDWSHDTGTPLWWGAVMPSNYAGAEGAVNYGGDRRGSDYTVPQQIEFIQFFIKELRLAGIPVALNADHIYWQTELREWYEPFTPLVESFFAA
jgi:endoglucanase